MKPKLTAYFDHDATLPLPDRIALAKHHGLNQIGLRYFQKRPLIEMSEKDAKALYQSFKEANMSISFLDGQIGHYDLNNDRDFKEHLERFKFLVELADRLKTQTVCMQLPHFTKVIDEYENIQLRLEPFFDYANRKRKRVLLLPSNDYKANTYAYVFKKMKPQHVDFLFDPVYFLSIKQSTTTAYRLLKRYIGAFACHDKDQHGNPRLLGYGKTDVIGLFKRLTRDRYNGLLIVDNEFYHQVFSQKTTKKGLFGFRAKREQKQKEALQKELSHVLFPNEQTRICTYDDVLANQIKLVSVFFS